MQRKHVLITGIIGWLGGLGTAVFGASCDTECPDTPRSAVLVSFVAADGSSLSPHGMDRLSYSFLPENDGSGDVTTEVVDLAGKCLDEDCSQWLVDADEPGTFDVTGVLCGQSYTARVEVIPSVETCEMETEQVTITVDPSACKTADVPATNRPDKCDRSGHPSVYVNVVQQKSDMIVPVTPKAGVWFEHDGDRYDAHCIASSEPGQCMGYIAGVEMTGRIKVGADFCDQTFIESTSVEMADDGCHVETEFVSLMVDTKGCIADAPEPDGDLPIRDRPEPPFDPDITDPPRPDPTPTDQGGE